MQNNIHAVIAAALLSVAANTTHAAQTLNDPQAQVIYLRTSCGSLSNCADNLYELLTWVWTVRQPSDRPLLVDIGPGQFPIQHPTADTLQFCNGGRNVTFRGSGRDRTVLIGPGANVKLPDFPSAEAAAMVIKNCDGLSFQDMTVRGDLFDLDGPATFAIAWIGGGHSNWSNVRAEASYYPWVDLCSNTGATGTHKWTGSDFESNGSGVLNVAYRSDCGFSEIHGSSLLAIKTQVNSPWSLIGVVANGQGEVQLYGSSVRVIVPPEADSNVAYSNTALSYAPAFGHGGLLAKDGGMIHMHGGIISVRHEHNGVNSSVFGARAIGAGSMVHALDTAFGVKASGTGIAERIMVEGGGRVDSPFQWPQSDTPPSVRSVTGADSYVETDCDSNGNCTGVPPEQQQTHWMIYNANCNTGGPWYDVNLNRCRMQ